MFSNADLRKLIFPLIVEQILAVSVGMVDTMMVSSVGEAATSGVSLVDMINTLFINIFAAVATGGAVVSSQYLGQKRRDRACQSADQLLIITGMLSLGIMILCILFRKGFLSLIYQGVAEDVMRNARVYLVISALSYPFLSVYNSCAALFRSMGNSKISMQASIIMNVINVIGDSLFIFVFHWGVAGAALASLISRMTACFILLYRLRNRNLDLYIGTGFKINRRMMKQILNIGIPNGIENSIFQLGRVLVVGIIAMFGTTQIAANAIANNLDGMGVLPGQAMSLAIITVVGRLVGAGDFDQAEYYAKKMMKLTYVVSGLCCIAVILTMPLTLRLYGLSPEALRMGAILVLIHNGCAIFIWPCSFCLANVLRAANDVKFPMCISIMSMILFRIGFSFLLAVGLELGAVGVWWAMIADWVVRSAFFGWRFFSGKWKRFYHAM
ncbi:MATE family efflux transporter [Enterocloster citroniae]|mgnify:CR=1 FL=1|nr:MATE family efflux transporter [Clostridium sp. FS41]KJJ75771.1 multidrug export protein MepA [Clostridium sp. FS41]